MVSQWLESTETCVTATFICRSSTEQLTQTTSATTATSSVKLQVSPQFSSPRSAHWHHILHNNDRDKRGICFLYKQSLSSTTGSGGHDVHIIAAVECTSLVDGTLPYLWMVVWTVLTTVRTASFHVEAESSPCQVVMQTRVSNLKTTRVFPG
jgi:hypothetical protein